MDKFLALKEYTSHLYRSVGQLKLYFRFNREIRAFDAKRLKLEIENIKQIIYSIENMIEKL